LPWLWEAVLFQVVTAINVREMEFVKEKRIAASSYQVRNERRKE
jgi:hypothetical protein